MEYPPENDRRLRIRHSATPPGRVTPHVRAAQHAVSYRLRTTIHMKASAKRPFIILLVLAATAFAIAGCQTTKGFGRDVEHLGGEIQGK